MRTYGNGAWTGELHLVLLQDKAKPSTRAGRSLWAVAEPLTYHTHAGDRITVPAGMVTDLASIPACVSWLLPPDGPWALAAVFHDLCCTTLGTGLLYAGKPPCISRSKPYTSAEAARILSEAMSDLNVPRWQRFAIWAAVRLFGPQWGRR